jgi:hypothetical protein
VNVAFFVAVVGIWIGFAWAMASRQAAPDVWWRWLRSRPLALQALIWIVGLPWMIGLASDWRAPAERIAVVALIAIGSMLAAGNIAFASE